MTDYWYSFINIKNKQKGFIAPLLIAIIAILIIGGGIYFYNSKKVAGPGSETQQVVSSLTCQDFSALSDSVLQNLQKVDSQKVMQMNPNVITSFHWKRNATEPFITYPVINGVEAYYGDDKTNHSIDFTVSAIKKDSDTLTQAIKIEAGNIGLSVNLLNTLPLQSFSNQDVTQTFGFEKGDSLYSVTLTVDSGDHQAPPQGVVRITCGKSLENYDKVYDALNLKADSSVKDSYNNDYAAIGGVSSDNTVYAILGSSNQIKIANYYYFDGNKLKLVSKDSYPAECSALESQKVGLGMRCVDKPSYNQRTVNYTSSTTSSQTATRSSNSNLNTYNNFGITFQYPNNWGVPKESLYGNGLGSISFDYDPSVAQPFAVFIQQDTNPQGTGLLNETLDQMIARFRTNDKYIYQVKNISASGVEGRELSYNSAVTGQPYHVEAYFPFSNNSYISLGADYQSVTQDTFDSIISTLKWDSSTAFKKDSVTGLAIYSNNGIRFEYPIKFNTDYASLNVQTSVGKVDSTKLDSNGCYPAMNDSGKSSPSSVLTVNGIKFCSNTSGGVGAGQLYTVYSYMTIRNGNAYTINYQVHTSNGCGVYQNSPDINSPDNQKYNECLNAKSNFGTTVVKPIQDSISTFTFTDGL